jgi:hypothetical protein
MSEAKERHQNGHNPGRVPTLTHNTRGFSVIVDDDLLYLELGTTHHHGLRRWAEAKPTTNQDLEPQPIPPPTPTN